MRKSGTFPKLFFIQAMLISKPYLRHAAILIIVPLLFFGNCLGQIPANINAAGTWSASSGSGSVTFAAGSCYSVTVTEWGGGGGGGGANNDGASGGGAGGGYAQAVVNIPGGSTCFYSVGVGGTAGATTGTNGGAGGPTWFNATSGTNNNTTGSFINAGGGAGGFGVTTNVGAAAQTTVGSGSFGSPGITDTVEYSGGTGGGGFVDGSGDGGGGGGGGGAGAGGNGGNGATTIVGGTGAFGCPNGGGGGGGGGGGATGPGANGVPGNNNGGGGTGGGANGGGAGGSANATAAGLAGTGTPGGAGNPIGGGGGAGNGCCGCSGGAGGDGAAGSGSIGGGGGGGTGDGGGGNGGNGGAHGGGGAGADGGSSAAGGTGGAGYLTITVAIVPPPTATAGPATAAICAGATSAIMGGSVSAGATALWTGGAGTWANATDPANATYTAGAAESGTITLTLTATSACGTGTATKTITVNPAPSAPTVTSPVMYCQNATATPLTATGTGSLLWYTVATGGVGNATAPTPSTVATGSTTYYVSQTLTGCESPRASIVVTINALPTAAATNTGPYCGITGNITVNATGGTTYSWSGPNAYTGTGASPTPFSAATYGAGIYDVTVSTANNCTATASTTVIVGNPPVPTVTSPVTYCQNAAATPLTATATGNLLWYTVATGGVGSATAPTPSTATPGSTTYYVSQTIAGCESSRASIVVIVHPMPTSTFTAVSPVCAFQNSAIQFTGTASAVANFQWGFSGGTVVSGTGAGPYQVNWGTAGNPAVTLTVTDSGCTSTPTTVNVQVNPTPTAVFTTTTPICANQTSTITYTGTGTGAGTYNWSFDGGVTISGTGSGPYVIGWPTAGSKNVTLAVTENGCTSPVADSIVVVNAVPVAAFGIAPAAACIGQTSTITFTGTADNAAVYTWSFGGGTTVSGTGAGPYVINWPTAGAQSITLSITDNGCVSNDTSMSFTVNPVPVSNAGAAVSFCSGASAPIGTASTAGETYLWTPPTGLSSATVSNPTANGTTTNTTSVTEYVVTTTAAGCSSTDSVQVTVYPVPVASFVAPATQCLTGNSYSFQAGGTFLNGAAFLWNFGANATPDSSITQNQTVQFSAAGPQTVSLIISQDGCVSAPFTATVNVAPMPVASFTADTVSGCVGLQVCFTNTSVSNNPSTYQWTFGDGQSSTLFNPCNVYSATGLFTVELKVLSADGCPGDTTVANYISISNPPVAAFMPAGATIQFPVDTITLYNQSSNATSLLWNFGVLGTSTSINPTLTFNLSGIYPVVLTASNGQGCSDSVEHDIIVLPPNAFFIPNVFTPNGDGHNDQFYIEAQEGVTVYKFLVFDRWGEKVHDGPYPWDGTYKGKPCQEGVYVYEAELGLAGQNDGIIRKGTVTLLR